MTIRPALVIGLGGTGSWAVGQLKSRLVNDQRYVLLGENPAASGSTAFNRHPFPVRGIAIDVDKIKRPTGAQSLERAIEDLGLDAPVGQALTYLKKPGNDQRSAYPTIEAWLPRSEAAEYDVNEAMTFMTSGAGQIRQFGRIAFFLDILNKGQVIGKLNAALGALRSAANPEGEVSIQIVGSVGGGAGAGLLVDTLLYLKDARQRLPGQVSMRTIVYVVLPGAFGAVLEPDKLALSQANGYGALREIDRLINAAETVNVSWQSGREVHLDGSVADHVYLIDGSRDLEQGIQLDNESRPEDTFPVAVADAIYAHVFPSTAETLLRDYPNLSAALIGGNHNRYSTFGTYLIQYDWERLIRSLSLKASREILQSRLRPSSLNARELAGQFLSGQAQDTFAHDGDYQKLPFLLTEIMTSPDAPTGGLEPVSHWLEPAEGVAPFPDAPNLHDFFPELRKVVVRWVTRYDNDQVMADTAGDPTVGSAGYLGDFWGEEFSQFKAGTSEPQFFPVANTNGQTAESDFARGLFLAAASVMNMNQAVGGITAALDFLTNVDQILETYSKHLDKVELPSLADFVAAVEEAKEEMRDDRRWDDGKEQHDYLEAEQDLLHERRRHVVLDRAKTLLTSFRYATGQAKDHVRGWEANVAHLAEEAERARLAVNEDRKAADASALRRMTPLPESSVDESLYRDCVGQDDPDLSVPTGLLEAMTNRAWNIYQRADNTQMITWRITKLSDDATEDSEPQPIKLSDLSEALTAVFAPLRERHVFEVLELEGNNPEQLADELRFGSARLAAFDQAQQLEYTVGNVEIQDWAYFWADWRTQGAGATLAAAVKTRLDGAKAANTAEPCNDLTAAASGTGLPTTDKIVAFSARHLILLDAFRGVQSLHHSYTTRRDTNPSPHVLPEEKGAALLEAKSEELAHAGITSAPIERVPAELVPLCVDTLFLQRFAVVYACDKVEHEITDELGHAGKWTLVHDNDSTDLGDEWELTDVLRRIAVGTDHDSTTARDAVKRIQLELAKDDATSATVQDFARDKSQRGELTLDSLLALAAGLQAGR